MKTPEQLPTSTDFTLLSTYEQWAAQNWLYQSGTDEAQLHAQAKLDEEVVELADALTTSVPEDIISEAGDVLWTSSASGSNTGITISRALAEHYPTIFNTETISTTAIDEAAMAAHQDMPLNELQTSLRQNGFRVAKYAKQWFRLRSLAKAPAETFTDALIATKRSRTIGALASLTLLTSYAAQQFAGSTLAGAMNDNYQKIEHRLNTGAAITKPPRI